jgi:hypothetical protein
VVPGKSGLIPPTPRPFANFATGPTWARIGDHYPELKGEGDHFLALDGESGREIGIVRRIEAGAETGQWQWSMLAHPGPTFSRPTSGTVATRDAAARELVACWQAFRRYYGLEE